MSWSSKEKQALRELETSAAALRRALSAISGAESAEIKQAWAHDVTLLKLAAEIIDRSRRPAAEWIR
jgi:hypothetical protein